MRLTLLMAVALAAFGQSADRTEVALHAAMKKEMVDGDLRGAIDAYKKLAQSRDQAIAAKALVRMGECYEKLGDAEARKAYERVVREFGGQKEAVAAASARLAALGKDTGASGVRVVSRSSPSTGGVFGPSPDGRYLLQLGVTGQLEIRNLGTDQVHTLSRSVPVRSATFSPDGRQVVYLSPGDSATEVRTVGADGSRDRVVWTHAKDGDVGIIGWSADGRQLVLQTWESRKPSRMLTVSTADSTVTALREGDWMRDALLSPDGRFVAYTVRDREKSAHEEIRLFSLADRSEVTVLRDTDMARDPRWTPESNGILFLSDRREPDKSWDLWLLRLSGGKPVDRPQLVKTDLGGGLKPLPLRDITRDGSYYFLAQQTTVFREIRTSALDPVTGRATGPVTPLDQHGGQSYAPSLSRDGRWLTYARPRSGGNLSFVIRSLKTGEETSVSTSLQQAGARLFPDGRSLLVNDLDKEGAGFYRMDIATGSTKLLKPGRFGNWYDLLSDGKTVYYSCPDDRAARRWRLLMWNIETGEERELLTEWGWGPNGAIMFNLSPDEQQIALSRYDGKNWFIQLMPAAGGDKREILRTSGPVGVEGWWPGGRYLLLITGTLRYFGELQRMPVSGGERQNLGLSALTSPIVYPDGSRIAFVSRPNQAQIWSLENFLPKDRK